MGSRELSNISLQWWCGEKLTNRVFSWPHLLGYSTAVEDGEFLFDTLQLSAIYGTAMLYNTTNL